MRFVTASTAKGHDVEYGIRTAIAPHLVSPHFLFRIERNGDPADPSKIHRISDVELASRLSYFLWRSMPDDELLAAGRSAQASDKTVLHAQVKRMLDDPRSASIADDFAGQWLETAQPGYRQTGPAERSLLGTGPARGDEDGNADVLRPHPAQ